MAVVHSLGVASALQHSLGHSLWSVGELPAHPEQTGISNTSYLAISCRGSSAPEQIQADSAKQSNQQRKWFVI